MGTRQRAGKALQQTYLLILILLTASWPLQALEKPVGNVLLVIDGNIQKSNTTENDLPTASFDLELLQSLDATTFTTGSTWTPDSEFTGVRLNTLLTAVGVDFNQVTIRASAANDYWYDLNKVDFDKYPVIVAYERDGEAMPLREMGPLWIVFPWDLHPELLNEKNKASSVWQLIKLTIK